MKQAKFNFEGLMALIEEGEIYCFDPSWPWLSIRARTMPIFLKLHHPWPLWPFWTLEDDAGKVRGLNQLQLWKMARALQSGTRKNGLSDLITQRVEQLTRERLDRILASSPASQRGAGE